MAVLGTTDISTTKVRNALGESSNDVGTLCKSNKINKFAKYKPVIYPANSTAGVANWWRSADNNCGIYVPTVAGPG